MSTKTKGDTHMKSCEKCAKFYQFCDGNVAGDATDCNDYNDINRKEKVMKDYTRQELEMLKTEVDKAIAVCDNTMSLVYVEPDLMTFHLDAWDVKFSIDNSLKRIGDYIDGIGTRESRIMAELIRNNIDNRDTGVLMAMGLEDDNAQHACNSILALNIVTQHLAMLKAWQESFSIERR
jgi:hypothetical protein